MISAPPAWDVTLKLSPENVEPSAKVKIGVPFSLTIKLLGLQRCRGSDRIDAWEINQVTDR